MAAYGHHIDRVETALTSPSAAGRSWLVSSWRRSAIVHKRDPGETTQMVRLDAQGLNDHLKQDATLHLSASAELDRLFKIVGRPGSGLFLTNSDGIVLDRRWHDADAGVFGKLGLDRGAICSEAYEGTNGMGTCLAEERLVIIDQDDHFRATYTGFTCIGAPIFGTNGELVGAIDYSAAHPAKDPQGNLLLASAVVQTAKRIEAALFHDAFRSHRIVVADGFSADDQSLFAINQDDFLIGATRAARLAFKFGVGAPLEAYPAADILGQENAARDIDEIRRAAILRALKRAAGNVSKASRQLGMGRATLYKQMKRLGIRD